MPSVQTGDNNETNLTDTFFQLHRHTLTNGLRVWCVPRPNTGTVAVMAHLPVGVRAEKPEYNGIAHFLEHMLFTGTERWNEADITDVVRRVGGECNAETAREETSYYIHLPATELAFGLDWLHQLLFKPTLPQDKFEKERQVIINEKGGDYEYLQRAWEWLEDHNLGWHVDRAVLRRIYPHSSFLLPIIGTDRTLKNITYTTLVNFYETYYVPHHVTLLVVGDVVPAQVFDMVEHQFGSITDRVTPNPIPPVTVNEQGFDVRLHGPTPTHQGQLFVGCVLGNNAHPDRFVWYTIGEMLENTYLQKMRYDRGMSYDTQVYPNLYSDTGHFKIYTNVDLNDLALARELILEEIYRLREGNFGLIDVQDAKNALRGRALLNLQDNLELASWISSDAITLRDDNAPYEDYFVGIHCVTPEDVQRVAQHYFSPERMHFVEHRPVLTTKEIFFGSLAFAGAAVLFTMRKNQS
ncbi:MAG: hypothetical protein CUN55_00020 [Phototrophicales bacterium]|nr:MAG: hypothetical protein CUN55_00020 [Phototrophicales bacterium]